MPDATPAPPAGTTLERALPSVLLIAVASLASLWGVLAQDWSVLAVVFVYVADGVADGLTFWLRARRAQGAASDEDAKDRVLVSEFVRTYFVVVAAMGLVLYMVFSGRLLKPGGGVPEGVFQPFATWQFWAVVAGFVAVRWFTYWWDWVRGEEAAFMPPAGVVAAPPLRAAVRGARRRAHRLLAPGFVRRRTGRPGPRRRGGGSGVGSTRAPAHGAHPRRRRGGGQGRAAPLTRPVLPPLSAAVYH